MAVFLACPMLASYKLESIDPGLAWIKECLRVGMSNRLLDGVLGDSSALI